MRRAIVAVVMMWTILVLNGCGSDSPPPVYRTEILSDADFDGDIARDPVTGTLTITQGMSPTVQSVFAGIDAATGTEYRAFLDFPLGGAEGVPVNAAIASAFLDIYIVSIAPARPVPVRIELVDFAPLTLDGSEFYREQVPPLAAVTILPEISPADVGRHVVVDVTHLMREAQRLQLPEFQVRIMQDPGVGLPGLIEIDDSTNTQLAPLLEVNYY